MPAKHEHLEFLDGLRGLASLWVFVGHAMFLTGYKITILAQPDLAVEMFIMISGFLMVYHYQARQAREPWQEPNTWLIFWLRRFFRIAPLYYIWLVIALLLGPALWNERMAIAAILPDSTTEPGRYLDQSLTNFFLHFTFLFGLTSEYNFKTPLPDWSIGLEMQFYAVLPFLMLFLRRWGGLMGMAVLLLAAGFIGVNLERLGFVKGAYSILALKFHLFAAGMIIAGSLRVSSRMRLVYFLAACAVIFIPLGGGRSELHRIIKILIVAVFFLLIYRDQLPRLFSWLSRPLNFILANRVSRIFGDLSYGVYLTHLLVLLPVCGLLARQWPVMESLPRFAVAMVLAAPLTYLISWFCYNAIELPGIAMGRRVAGKLGALRAPQQHQAV